MKAWWLSASLIGLVIVLAEGLLNGVILLEPWRQMNQSLGLNDPDSFTMILAMGKLFGLGFVAMWLYDLFVLKYGAGWLTAARVGLFLAFMIWVWALAGLYLAGYINPTIATVTLIWGIVELPLACITGVWLRSTLVKVNK